MISAEKVSVVDEALRCGAELIVHAYEDGRAPGRARLDRLGMPSVSIPMAGVSEDLAMLLAFDKGAELIVAVPPDASWTDGVRAAPCLVGDPKGQFLPRSVRGSGL